ncbi:MAG TPA: hypothetical protein PLH43_09405 [Acetivibrio sp.]|uniref:hypothetical protein n=1 Tax=Acetivibrio sp. TaxID=1872092 RepID=UPI002CBCE65F|nr:hypothetical protein [Acetivibrio sp.]HOM03029.1 hypothetical protein [Acetivibrio sp.]
MKNVIKKIFRKIKNLFRKIFYKTENKTINYNTCNPENTNNYICFPYHGQLISIKINELPYWKKLSRKEKRTMARKFKIMEEKGKIKFVKVGNKYICLKNKI